MRIEGTIIRGQGDAHINYERMIAAVADHCREVKDCGRFGSINVSLDQPIDKGRADCWTPRVRWKPKTMSGKLWDQRIDREEEFGFIKIKFEYPLHGPLYDACIILPSGHGATYFDAKYLEIISAELVGGSRVAYDTRCAIHLDHVPSVSRPPSFGDNFRR